jgi:hypothetical protein
MPHTDRTRLIFALHFHQPYGNLDAVFADATDRCYLRTLELMAAHPHVRAAVHVSGSLLEWAERRRPQLIDALAQAVARDQIEVLGGGWQEPMLAILPDRDAIGQLALMADRCETMLGQRPRGMWLTERVWEPDLARVIAHAGYRYTLLDDSHLRAAGAGKKLGAYYVTDKAGDAVAVFPIDRGLRTRIPFAEVDDLIAYLAEQRGRTVTYGDDVEKFGLWPTTEKRVWAAGWLEKFFEAIEAEASWLTTEVPSEVLSSTPSSGPVYIPTISYAEMGAWTLPPASSIAYQQLARRLEYAGFGGESEAYLRGGIWQGFLSKYPESRLIYRKMLRVSAAVERARQRDDSNYPAARDALYRGQCNCAYWHGMFGGLYLQHLRAALMSTLIEAEQLVEPHDTVSVSQSDHDGDLDDELLFEGPALNLYVSPARGGSAFEIDLRDAAFHLTGVLGRRREAYHEDVARAQVVSDDELENISAHDLVRATEEGLADRLRIDRHPRGAFVDHLLPHDTNADDFDAGVTPIHDLAAERYQVVAVGDTSADLSVEHDSFELHKRIAMSRRGVVASYRLTGKGTAPLKTVCFASHIDVTLLSPETVGGRSIEVLAGSVAERRGGDADDVTAPGFRGMHRKVSKLWVACSDLGIDVQLNVEPPAELWRLPIETVSQSERGFERAYQGTALVLAWRHDLSQGALEATVSLSLPQA